MTECVARPEVQVRRAINKHEIEFVSQKASGLGEEKILITGLIRPLQSSLVAKEPNFRFQAQHLQARRAQMKIREEVLGCI